MSFLDLGSLTEVTFAISLIYYQFMIEHNIDRIGKALQVEYRDKEKQVRFEEFYNDSGFQKKNFYGTIFIKRGVSRYISACIVFFSIIFLFWITTTKVESNRFTFLFFAWILLFCCFAIIILFFLDITYSKHIKKKFRNWDKYHNKNNNEKIKKELEEDTKLEEFE